MASIKVFDPVSVPLSVLQELQQLRARVERLCQENDRLRRENDRLRRELDEARASLDQARRQSKRQAAPFSKGPPKPQPRRPGRKSGQAHGRHGHRSPPDPAAVDEVLEAPLPGACPRCGGPVRQTGVAAQYQTEIPRRPLIRLFHVHVGCCTACGRRVQGRHPLQTSDALGAAAAQIGPDAQAAVALLNKTFGLSHIKVAAVFRALFGIGLTRGGSAQIVLRAGDRLGPAYQEIRQEIKSAACVTPDETGWRVAGRPAWLHAWVAKRATCYAIDPHRKADVLERLIGIDWPGTMVHDGFASYDRFAAATHQQCLGHLLRRVRGLEAEATRGAVHYPRKLIALFTEAIHLRNRHKDGAVTARQLERAREGFDRRLRVLAWPAREVPAYETLSEHLWNHLDEWFTFLSHPEVEPTNWEVEQAIRPAVVNRKVWGGNRTWAGARAQEVLMSVLETCRRAGHPGLEFVSQTLRAFANPTLPRPILLTPR
ncbi:MAG TPA: IS66 family transposase [Candidatus Sulfotelmatobacter sp.]|nr:IS66 family transposase [Candidatus Sulfotelmatobacter sp.]